MDEATPATRAERRAKTHAAILAAARQTFAEDGYQRATIRAVAQRAGYDPALVMKHFGSKEALFRAATAMDLDVSQAWEGRDDQRNERLLRHILERLDANPEAAASTLRSMLTHDDAADEALRLFRRPEPVTGPDAPDDAEDLRQQLVMALVLGTALTRYVLRSTPVEKAALEELVSILLPAVDALTAAPSPRPAR